MEPETSLFLTVRCRCTRIASLPPTARCKWLSTLFDTQEQAFLSGCCPVMILNRNSLPDASLVPSPRCERVFSCAPEKICLAAQCFGWAPTVISLLLTASCQWDLMKEASMFGLAARCRWPPTRSGTQEQALLRCPDSEAKLLVFARRRWVVVDASLFSLSVGSKLNFICS